MQMSTGGLATALAGALLLAGCATARPAAEPAPDLTPPRGRPAPAHASLYANCLAEAVASGRVELSDDASTQLLRFSCRGAPADAMFSALAGWSAARGSEWRRDGRTWRSTLKVHRNLFGVDYCSAPEGGGGAECLLTMNAGGFLTAP